MKVLIVSLVLGLSFGNAWAQDSFQKLPKKKAPKKLSLEEQLVEGGPTGLFAEDALRYVLVHELLKHGKTPLKGHANCNAAYTVAGWTAFNLANFGENKTSNVTVKCEKVDNKPFCSVFFNADTTGQSPWNCGYRFEVTPTQKDKIKISTLQCAGPC